MHIPRFALLPLVAGAVFARPATAQTLPSVTLSDVYSLPVPEDTSSAVTVNGADQLRSLSVNDNRGSAWLGTLYVTRREVTSATVPTAPPDVFFWRAAATNPQAAAGSGALKPAGPDLRHPDGRFDMAVLAAAGYIPTGNNSMWGIGVADDDYVYVTGLTSGKVARFDPDGTDPVLVVASGFTRARAIYVTGQGMDTRLWLAKDNNAAATTFERWKPTTTAADGGPTNFIQEVLFTVAENANQAHQSVVNSTHTAAYYGRVTSGVTNSRTPVKRSIASGTAGEEDVAFSDAMALAGIKGATGVTIDSADRVLYFAMHHPAQDWGIVAVDPVTGTNLTTNLSAVGGFNFFTPPGAIEQNVNYTNFVQMARYSDRHHFYLYSENATANAPGTGATLLGVVASDIPAAAPTGVSATNPGTGSSLALHWTLADPEAVGVDIYRSTTSGSLGTKVNGAPVDGGATTYTDTGLSANATYYYTVRAVATDPFTAATYTSDNTDQVSAATAPIGIPDAPTAQSATDEGDGSGIRLAWTNPTKDLDAIRVYRSTASGTLGAVLTPGPTAPVAGAAQEYLDATAQRGVTYFYTIRAVNGAGQESTNTAQVSATATDAVAPTFAGAVSVKDYGVPGIRIRWAPATDNSSPIRYNIYTGSDATTVDYSTPAATTTTTSGEYDLTGLPLGRDVFIVVRAEDAVGNEESNIAMLWGTTYRVIVDSDQNIGVNHDRVDPRPDSAVPAMIPSPGYQKANLPDVPNQGFLPGVSYYNTNDKLGKVSYSVPIPQAGRYEIAAAWGTHANLLAPGYQFHVTYPDGTTETFTTLTDGTLIEQSPSTANRWNLLTTRDLSAGTLTIVGDATHVTDLDPSHWHVSGVVRALLVPTTPVSIYKAATAPVIDGVLAPSEWGGVAPIRLGALPQNVAPPNTSTGARDYSANVYTRWDATAFYIAADVNDDVVSFPYTDNSLIWQRDALELYLGLSDPQDPARNFYDAGDSQIVLSAQESGGVLTGEWYSPQAPALSATTNNVVVKRRTGGYVLEARIPWDDLGQMAPEQGRIIGFNLHGDDNDQATPTQDAAFSLSEKGQSFANPANWLQAVLLGVPPSIPGDVNGDGAVDLADVRLAVRIAGGLQNGADLSVSHTAADMNADGAVDLADAVRINRKANQP